MEVRGFTTVMGGSLSCEVVGEDWHFSIRRVDDKTDNTFYNFHGKAVTSSDIAAFLPNLPTLEWTELKDQPIFCKSESYAKDVEYKVNVQSSDAGKKTHAEVVQAFMTFMA